MYQAYFMATDGEYTKMFHSAFAFWSFGSNRTVFLIRGSNEEFLLSLGNVVVLTSPFCAIKALECDIKQDLKRSADRPFRKELTQKHIIKDG